MKITIFSGLRQTLQCFSPKTIDTLAQFSDLSAGTGKLCILDILGLVLIWIFSFCVLVLLFYVSLLNLCSGTHRRNPIFTENLAHPRCTCKNL